MVARLRRAACASLLSLPLWSGGWMARAQDELRRAAEAETAGTRDSQAGNYSNAEPELHRAYDLVYNTSGQQDLRVRIAFEWVDVDLILGHFDPALKLLADLRQVGDPLMKANALFLSGEALRAKGDYSGAQESYTQALRLAARGPNGELARYLTGLGELQRLRGVFPDAATSLGNALTLEEGQHDTPALVHSATLAALGDLDRAREQYPQANDRYAAAKSILESLGGTEQPLLARVLLGFGELALIQNKTDDAAAQFKQAYQFCSELKESQILASVEDAIGRLNLAEENFAGALAHLNTAYQLRKVLGDAHPDTAASLDHLGLLYLAQDKTSEAAGPLTKADAARRQALGPKHPDWALSLEHVSVLNRRQHQYAEAETHITAALHIQTEILGEGSLAVAHSRYELGNLRVDQQKAAEAEGAYRQALAVQSRRLADNHPDRLATSLALAVVLHAGKQDAEAQQFLAGWMKARGDNLPPGDPNRRRALTIFTEIQLDKKQYAEAEQTARRISPFPAGDPLLSRILAVADSLYNEHNFKDAAGLYALAVLDLPETPESAVVWQKLGDCYAARKQSPDATRAYRAALEIRKKTLKPDDPLITASLLALSESLLAESNLDDAEKVLSVYLQQDATFNPDVLTVVEKLAKALRERHLSGRAEPYLRRALAFAQQPGMRAQALDRVLRELAENCADQGKDGDAAQFYEQLAGRAMANPAGAQKDLLLAVALWENAGGKNNPSLIQALQRLGDVYLDQQTYPDARQVFERAQGILEQSAQPEDPRLAISLNGLGMVAEAQKENDQAALLFDKALAQLRKRPNPPRATLAAVLFNLGSLAFDNNQIPKAGAFFSQCADLFKEAGSADDPPPLKQLNRFAEFYLRIGCPASAEKLYEEGERLSGAAFGQDSIEHGTQLTNLADVYAVERRYANAVADYKEAAAVFQKQNGGDGTEAYANAMSSLASVYQKTKDFPAAIAALETLRHIKQDRSDATLTLNDLASSYSGAGEYAKAVQTYQDVLKLWPEGEKEEHYLAAEINMVAALESNKDPGAKKMFQRVQRTLEDRGKADDEQMLLKKYVEALSRNSRTAEAKKLAKQIKSSAVVAITTPAAACVLPGGTEP
jgi:tetratricopeptide (TPR) repeat protein